MAQSTISIPRNILIAFIEVDSWVERGERGLLIKKAISPNISSLEYLNKYYWNFFKYIYAEGDMINYSRIAGKTISNEVGTNIYCCIAYKKNI